MSTRKLVFTLSWCAVPTAIALRPAAAQAHVKWFCAFDVAGSPVELANILCQDFEQLSALAIGMLLLGAVVAGSPLGSALLRSLDQTMGPLRRHTEIMVRIVAAGFFASLWAMNGVLLTPELTTDLSFVPWLQLAMAAAMLSRRTLPLAALGIVALFALAVRQYGLFHLMDYPVFLGLAAYLACVGLQHPPCRVRPLDLLRWSGAVTLMWAAIEKWAYPQWTFPIFVTHPGMSFGFDVAYYMRAAGVVEFTLAFALLGTPLVRRSHWRVRNGRRHRAFVHHRRHARGRGGRRPGAGAPPHAAAHAHQLFGDSRGVPRGLLWPSHRPVRLDDGLSPTGHRLRGASSGESRRGH